MKKEECKKSFDKDCWNCIFFNQDPIPNFQDDTGFCTINATKERIFKSYFYCKFFTTGDIDNVVSSIKKECVFFFGGDKFINKTGESKTCLGTYCSCFIDEVTKKELGFKMSDTLSITDINNCLHCLHSCNTLINSLRKYKEECCYFQTGIENRICLYDLQSLPYEEGIEICKKCNLKQKPICTDDSNYKACFKAGYFPKCYEPDKDFYERCIEGMRILYSKSKHYKKETCRKCYIKYNFTDTTGG